MAFPDFETLTVARLALCLAEIPGIARVFAQAPSQPIPDSELPAAMVLVGAMQGAIPAVTAGNQTVTRTYVVRLLIAPLQAAGIDYANDGAAALTELLPFFAKIRDYLLSHPRLNTASLGALAYMAQDVTFSDTGGVVRTGPGGSQYVACDWQLTISMRAVIAPSRIS